MLKIICISDLHGHLVKIPKTDLVIIAGDVCPIHNHDLDYQSNWINNEFKNWVNDLPTNKTIFVAGNHDLALQQCKNKIDFDKINASYLEDSWVEYQGLKIWGSPWIKRIWGAFNLSEPELKLKYDNIPDDINIIISHGPPYNYGDLVWYEHVGSVSLLDKINNLDKLQAVIYGHIHCSYGQYNLNNKKLINAALVNEEYIPTNYPIEIEL